MALRADVRYDGTVTRAEWIESANTGTRGLELDLETPEGEIAVYQIWVSPKSLEIASKQFRILGADDDDLLDASHMEHVFPSDCVGKKVRFKTFEDTYKNKVTVKVERLLPPASEGSGGIGGGVADLFRQAKGLPAAKAPAPAAAEVSDEDIPFSWALWIAPLAALGFFA
jgi:hypothetical protein